MWSDYYELIAAVEELTSAVIFEGNRLYVLGLILLIIICFNIFRRKEHV